MLTKSDSDALYPSIASEKDGKISRTNPRPRKLAATAKECPTSLTTRGNTSAEMAGGDGRRRCARSWSVCDNNKNSEHANEGHASITSLALLKGKSEN